MKARVIIAMLLALVGTASAQESNLDGGSMIAHHPPGLAYTSDAVDWCGNYDSQYPLLAAGDQHNRIDGDIGSGYVWYVIAAFFDDKIWCGTQFGFDAGYNPAMFYIDGYGPCLEGSLELPTAGWPGPHEGTAVVATSTPWVGNFQAVYWFGGYIYGETLMRIDVDPSVDFIGFGNCEAPSQIWPAIGGGMGILTEGIYVGPIVPEDPAACCFYPGVCLITGHDECGENGGIWHGDEPSCDPNPCLYACCLADGTCEVTTESGCQGTIMFEFPSCDSDPCVPPTAVDETSWGSIKSIYR